ncbi:MAG TPA: hypothetical protein VK812_10190 [Candidatus Binatus sp.]|jgi:hypothetical protein|nr:hypothetical protein [Candidatus Binatus sp.]
MFDPSSPTPIWEVWPYLSSLERLLFIGLIVLGAYVLFSAIFTVLRVRKGGELRSGVDAQTLRALRKRSTRVDKLITMAFYLFGWVLFSGLHGAYSSIIDGKAAVVERGILQDFEPHFAFAANAFFVFLMLYVVAWFTSSRVSRLALEPIP